MQSGKIICGQRVNAHVCVQEFSPVSGGYLKVIRGQRVLNLGIVFRCGEEACINTKVIRGQRVNAHADSRIFVSGGSILDGNFISGQIVNAHADSRIFTSK